jgi:hypothetical protein
VHAAFGARPPAAARRAGVRVLSRVLAERSKMPVGRLFATPQRRCIGSTTM